MSLARKPKPPSEPPPAATLSRPQYLWSPPKGTDSAVLAASPHARNTGPLILSPSRLGFPGGSPVKGVRPSTEDLARMRAAGGGQRAPHFKAGDRPLRPAEFPPIGGRPPPQRRPSPSPSATSDESDGSLGDAASTASSERSRYDPGPSNPDLPPVDVRQWRVRRLPRGAFGTGLGRRRSTAASARGSLPSPRAGGGTSDSSGTDSDGSGASTLSAEVRRQQQFWDATLAARVPEPYPPSEHVAEWSAVSTTAGSETCTLPSQGGMGVVAPEVKTELMKAPAYKKLTKVTKKHVKRLGLTRQHVDELFKTWSKYKGRRPSPADPTVPTSQARLELLYKEVFRVPRVPFLDALMASLCRAIRDTPVWFSSSDNARVNYSEFVTIVTALCSAHRDRVVLEAFFAINQSRTGFITFPEFELFLNFVTDEEGDTVPGDIRLPRAPAPNPASRLWRRLRCLPPRTAAEAQPKRRHRYRRQRSGVPEETKAGAGGSDTEEDSPRSGDNLRPPSESEVSARQVFDRFDLARDGVMDLQEFVTMHRKYPVLLHPLYRLQAALRRRVLGEAAWRHVCYFLGDPPVLPVVLQPPPILAEAAAPEAKYSGLFRRHRPRITAAEAATKQIYGFTAAAARREGVDLNKDYDDSQAWHLPAPKSFWGRAKAATRARLRYLCCSKECCLLHCTPTPDLDTRGRAADDFDGVVTSVPSVRRPPAV